MPRVNKSVTIGRHALALALGLALFAPHAMGQTLTLSNDGEHTARSEDYPNYTDMVIDKGVWHLYGPLVSNTTALRGGARILLNDSANLGSGLTTIDGAILQAEASRVDLNQQFKLQVGSLTVDGSNILSLTNTITGGGGITKIGSGELIVRGNNTYSAGTLIGEGVINAQSNNALSNGTITFNGTGNGVLRSSESNISLANFFVNMAKSGTIDTQTDLVINGRIGGNGVMTKTGAGRLRFTGPWVNMGNVVLRDGTIDMGTNVELGGGSLIVYKGSLDSDIDQEFYNPLVLNGALTMTSLRNWEFAANISGAGDFHWNSASTVTFNPDKSSVSNTFTGNVFLHDGALVVASSNALRSGRVVLDGGLLTNSAAISSLSNIDVQKDSRIQANYNWSLNGNLTGAANLTKTGSGVLNINGATTNFDGGLYAQTGQVNVSQQYTGRVGVSSSATMQMGNSNDDILADYIDGYLNLGGGDDTLTLAAQNISNIKGIANGESGNNTLHIVNGNDLYEFTLTGSKFLNFGVLSLDGPVGVTLNGPVSFMSQDPLVSGVTVKSDSFLDLNGATLTTNRADIMGGLFGSGTIDGSVTTNNIFAPSGVPHFSDARGEKSTMGIVHITGDLNTIGGQWFIHANDSGASDQIVVDGVANISGATVVALPQNGTYADRTVYSFLKANQMVGSFDGVVQNTFAFLTASLNTHANGVDLILERYVAPPVVVPPVVVPPVVEPPVVVPPVVVPPVVVPPVVVPPVVEPPVVVPPVVVPPVVEPPVVVPPVVVPPVVEPPVVVPPVIEPVAPPTAEVGPPIVVPGPGNLRYDEFSGLTRNQRAMAYSLQESEWRNQGELNDLLGQVRALQTSEVVNAFDQLTGESYAAMKNAEADALQYVLDLMDQREIDEGVAIWGDALWFETPLDRNIDTAPITTTTNGVAVGLDVGGEHLRGGVFAFKNHSEWSGDRSEQMKTERVGGGLRGQLHTDTWELRTTAAYSKSDIDTNRSIVLGANLPLTTSAAVQAKSLGMAMQARYNLIKRNWLLTPILQASYVSTEIDGFHEYGSIAALNISSSRSEQTVVGGGLGVARNIVLKGSEVRFYIDGKYMRNLDHSNDTITTSFAASGLDFEIVGSKRERTWWNTTVGVDVRSKSWTFSAQAQADMFKRTNAYKMNISATYKFK